MPRIFDNIETSLLPALRDTLQISERADFCVGYFNLRGWRQIDSLIEPWDGGDGACCRLLVGMQASPQEELRAALRLGGDDGLDNQTVLRLKRKAAEEFRDQLMWGAPTNQDEAGLRRLSAQLRSKKLIVKLFLRHPLHAKLYLLHRTDPNNPHTGFLGSSNLTLAGLCNQGELNVDVLDHDACIKLERWFEARWKERWCLDISDDLAAIIDESWAREQALPPYHIYLKIAYHLSQEARAGIGEFSIPEEFGNRLFGYQVKAVQIAARHLKKRRGVLIGDVVGLGKTLMATALAKIFELHREFRTETLIICPKNLVSMWEDYVHRYRLVAKVISISTVTTVLPEMHTYRVVLIDESHNLRNREGKRFKAIQDYIDRKGSRCILLSATPYNKTYLDLSSQLRLFLSEDENLGVMPEQAIRDVGEIEFRRRHQCLPNTLAAFEKSEHADDWRELMRRYMVRRTRSFIKDNYTKEDKPTGRRYLELEGGGRAYFPARVPRTVRFTIDDRNTGDVYARLYSPDVVDVVNHLFLPRYGLGNYIAPSPHGPPTATEARQLDDLGRAGPRLMGFCRTNLFKRLESGGPAFIQSIERHILRNFIYLHAIENGLDIPLGTQGAELLDTRTADEDADAMLPGLDDDEDEEPDTTGGGAAEPGSEADYRRRAAEVYGQYAGPYKRRFKWLRPSLFVDTLGEDLLADARALIGVLARCGTWNPDADAKLGALVRLLTDEHPEQKVLVFTQFADTVRYLTEQLRVRGVAAMEGVTGGSADPTAIARRFSPVSNDARDRVAAGDELRVLVATDVLSEGQNLQDCAVIVNYDLPWAIIRLIQRAGRVDRIGQQADEISCYSFLPADGVERIINLRRRVRQRLRENREVVGSDEDFFDDDRDDGPLLDLYSEKAGILDGDADTEIDLASYAYQIWKNAIDADPAVERAVRSLPDVVYSTRAHTATAEAPEGVLVYIRTADDTDSLAWIGRDGTPVTHSQLAILQAAACAPGTPAMPRDEQHHDLVEQGVKQIAEEERSVGGELGRPAGARFRTYERLKQYRQRLGDKRDLFISDEFVQGIERASEEIYRYPLKQAATDMLNRMLRSNTTDENFARGVIELRDDNRLAGSTMTMARQRSHGSSARWAYSKTDGGDSRWRPKHEVHDRNSSEASTLHGCSWKSLGGTDCARLM